MDLGGAAAGGVRPGVAVGAPGGSAGTVRHARPAAHLAHWRHAHVAVAPAAGRTRAILPPGTAAAAQRRFAGAGAGWTARSRAASLPAGGAQDPGSDSRHLRHAVPRALRLQSPRRGRGLSCRRGPWRRDLLLRRAARVAFAAARVPWRHVLQERRAGGLRGSAFAVRARRSRLQPLLHLSRGRIRVAVCAAAAPVPPGSGRELLLGRSLPDRTGESRSRGFRGVLVLPEAGVPSGRCESRRADGTRREPHKENAGLPQFEADPGEAGRRLHPFRSPVGGEGRMGQVPRAEPGASRGTSARRRRPGYRVIQRPGAGSEPDSGPGALDAGGENRRGEDTPGQREHQ